jgi:hypothetical protein
MTTTTLRSAPLAIALALSSFAALAPRANAQVVSLGNLISTNSVQNLNVTGLTGGPYNRVTFTTNWSPIDALTFSEGVAFNFNITPSLYPIIASLSSISGFNPNNTPTAMSAVCNLSIPVSSSTALQMTRAQTLGFPTHTAIWDNTVLTFSYFQRPVVLPSGIRNLAVRGSSDSAFSITTGSSPGSPAVGLYSSEGYLIASNINAASTPPGTQPTTGLLLPQPVVDPGLSNLFLPEGQYYVFVGGSGTTFTTDDFAANVPSAAPGFTLAGGVGSGPWTDPTFGTGQGGWYSFTIVPTPPSAAALAFLAIAASRRRR